MVKMGVSLPDDTFERLAELSSRLGYPSISSAIRDAVELFIAFRRWWLLGGPVAGTLQALVVGSRARRALARLSEVEEEYKDVIAGSLRLPLGEYVLYLLIVRGSGDRVKSLYNEVLRVQGVVAVQPSLLPVEA